jgi:signal transduction histidine kinase
VYALVAAGYAPAVYFASRIVPPKVAAASFSTMFFPDLWWKPYSLWLAGSLVAALVFQIRFSHYGPSRWQRWFHQFLAQYFGIAAVLSVVLFLQVPEAELPAVAVGTALALSALLPGAVFLYLGLWRHLFGIGVQRNLVYAVTATFLALLYLAVARRVSVWLEPVLPPEATVSILLFALVFLFEPLQRHIGQALRSAFRGEVDRLQRLTGEFHEQARQGNLAALTEFAARRIAEEFSLASVHIRLSSAPRPEPADGRVQVFPLRKADQEIGTLEVRFHGAFLSGETAAALAFLAEQLPAAIDLCRLIDEKLRMERELAERERLALLGRMAASISHNLKNPLGSMKTILQVQLEDASLPELVRRDCELVVAEMDRLSRKLNQLLRYARPELQPVHGCVALQAQAEQIVSLLRREAVRQRVSLEFVGLPGEVHVPGTEEALHDIVSNLLVNAIEAANSGGHVSLWLVRRGEEVVLEVTDDGPGIPPELRNKIFQPFFTTKASGTGLGLAIVMRRVEEMGGAVRWESPVANGRGTRFTVTLPIAEGNGS